MVVFLWWCVVVWWCGAGGLDAEAEVYVLLVAGVGVGVVGGTAVELVALAQFASDEEAESYGAEAGGDPAYGLEESGFFFTILVVAREWESAGGFRSNVFVALGGAKHHILDDSSGTLVLDEMVVQRRWCFCVIGFLTLNVRKGCILSGVDC
jgi:hypothetical protein